MQTENVDLSVTGANALTLAVHLVAKVYDAVNRPDLAAMIRAGQAEDFPEIADTAALLEHETARIGRYESALRQYADPGLWDDTTPGGMLALHDAGEMARNVLAGRPVFNHRD